MFGRQPPSIQGEDPFERQQKRRISQMTQPAVRKSLPTFVDIGTDMLPVMSGKDAHKFLGKQFSGELHDRASRNLSYRIECAWAKDHANSSTFTNRAISLKLRLNLFNTIVTPTALYSLASTALNKTQRQRLAFTRHAMLQRIVGYRRFDNESWEEAGHRTK